MFKYDENGRRRFAIGTILWVFALLFLCNLGLRLLIDFWSNNPPALSLKDYAGAALISVALLAILGWQEAKIK